MMVLAGLFALLVLGAALLRIWIRHHSNQLATSPLPLPDDLAGRLPAGRASILAFSTPSCAECRTRQAPALVRLRERVGDAVAVVSLQALDYPDLVAQLGILTVPATVVLDGARHVRHLNLGYASTEQLVSQALPQ
jgi:hypothetical protein